jgi:hypothetical protein
MLALEVDGDEWSASHTGHFMPLYAGNHWTGHWVGPRASLDTAAKRKHPFIACHKLKHWSSGLYPSHYTD